MNLSGRSVRLEPLRIEHVEALAAAASGPRETYAFTLVPDGIDAMRAYIESALADQERGIAVPFATIRATDGNVVGSTRFGNIEHWSWPEGSPHVRPVDACEVGWTWLSAEAQRTAMNTEAKYLMFRHAFETWRVHRLQLRTDERNARSRAAILRVGAQFEGILRSMQPGYDGTIRSTACYSITEHEWPDVKAALEAKLAAYR